MRRLFSFILTVLLIFSFVFLLSGCGETSITVESVLKTDENFAGTRILNISLPSDIGAASAASKLKESLPDLGKYGGSLDVKDVSDSDNPNEISYVLSFESMEDYEEKIEALLGKEVTVSMASPDNILAEGIRYLEDFDASELLSWVTDVFENNYDVENISYFFESNVVDLNGSLFTTPTTAFVNEVEGSEINGITISTANSKMDLYDREFTFEISQEVSSELGDNLKYYFDECTNELARYSDWTSKGDFQEYKVIFKDLSAAELQNVTNQILGGSDGAIVYGDLTNSSTPLSEGLIFEERLNTMNYMGKNKGMVPVTYQYSVPTNTTYGEGSVLKNGSWTSTGQWQDSEYTLELNDGAAYIHIPDGIQYEITGMNFYLNNNGGDSFKRTVDILFAKDNNEGLSYAYNFFKAKDAKVSKEETDSSFICRIETEGTALEISNKSVEYFGGGNYMNYEYRKNSFDLADNTALIDYINMGYMLTTENAEKPMTYTVTQSGNENINRVFIDAGSVTERLDKPSENSSFTLEFKGGNASVTYNGTIADWGKVVWFSVICGVIVLFSAALSVFFIRKSLKKGSRPENNLPQAEIVYLGDLDNNQKEDE